MILAFSMECTNIEYENKKLRTPAFLGTVHCSSLILLCIIYLPLLTVLLSACQAKTGKDATRGRKPQSSSQRELRSIAKSCEAGEGGMEFASLFWCALFNVIILPHRSDN